MRITTKGQVTIPIEIREKAGLLPNTEVEFRIKGNTVTLKRKKEGHKFISFFLMKGNPGSCNQAFHSSLGDFGVINKEVGHFQMRLPADREGLRSSECGLGVE